MERRKNVILTRGRDVPIVKIESGNISQYDHMLREQDQSRVHDVFEYLLGNDLTPYLGGGVTESWFYNGTQNYTDVDIVGVAKIDKRLKEPKAQKAALAFKRATKQPGIVLGSSAFKVLDDNPQEYMNMRSLDERFLLLPCLTPDELEGLVNMPKDIDISLISSEKFKRQHQDLHNIFRRVSRNR